MMRRMFFGLMLLFALVLAVPVADAPAAAQAARDWRPHVVRTPAGAFAIGNPEAPVKIAEYLSYTCGHCALFAREARPVLIDQWVRDGKVRLELRNAVRDPVDLSGAMLARCAGPAKFLEMSEALFAGQGAIMQRASTLAGQGLGSDFKAIAERTGITAIARAHGMSAAQVDACFADTSDRDRLLVMANAAFQRIGGTPSFEINGRLVDAHGWAALEPLVRAAGVN